MKSKDQKKLENIYSSVGKSVFEESKKNINVLNELNLGANADTVSGGLGSPENVFIPTHSPEDYTEAKSYCPKCKYSSEDNEDYADEKGCCKKCRYCKKVELMRVAEDESENQLFVNKVKVDLYDKGDNLTRFDDYTVKLAEINYEINVDYSKSGIKSINLYPKGNVDVEIICITWGDNGDMEEAKKIKINTQMLKPNFERNRSVDYIPQIEITGIELYLLKDFTIDYNRSTYIIQC